MRRHPPAGHRETSCSARKLVLEAAAHKRAGMGCSVHRAEAALAESAARTARTDCSVHRAEEWVTPAGLAADCTVVAEAAAHRQSARWESVARAARTDYFVHRAAAEAVVEAAAHKGVVEAAAEAAAHRVVADPGAGTPVRSGRMT